MYIINSDKNISEIVGIVRSEGRQLDMIPSDISNGVRSSFSAVLHGGTGSAGNMLSGRSEPGVKVVIYDHGNQRTVEIEALGVSPAGQKFNLKKSEQLCDRLYSELNQGSAVNAAQSTAVMNGKETERPPKEKEPVIEAKQEEDFASKFMKGFKTIHPEPEKKPVIPVSEPEPEIESNPPIYEETVPQTEPRKPAEPVEPLIRSQSSQPPQPLKPSGGINKKILFIAGGVVAVALIIALLMSMIHKKDEPYYEDPESTVTEESADEESSEAEREEETETEAVTQTGLDGAVILSSDWDWDSSRSGSCYVVDAIMLVRNDSDQVITSIEFDAYSEDGYYINNAAAPGNSFTAYGFVDAGASGIMVAEIYTDEEKVRPDDSEYIITAITYSENARDYIVPEGYVINNYGEDNNYYDVSVDNPNDFDVHGDSTIVMVKIENGKITDSDATGRLTDPIYANTYGNIVKQAFYDPHMYTKYEELTVLIIDKLYLENVQ